MAQDIKSGMLKGIGRNVILYAGRYWCKWSCIMDDIRTVYAIVDSYASRTMSLST
jgi:hypothetical protein